MNDIAVFGAGGFGREVRMLIDQINSKTNQWNFIGFFDDNLNTERSELKAPFLGNMGDLNAFENKLSLVFAIGDPRIKEKLVSKVKNQLIDYPILIHPNVQIGESYYNTIGHGSIITAGNIITVNTQIGAHVILNLACTVGHDTVIGDYCSFMPGVNISGEVTFAKGVYVGTGVKIINQIQIGMNTVVGAGAVVSKTLPANCTAVGVPAKPVKFHN